MITIPTIGTIGERELIRLIRETITVDELILPRDDDAVAFPSQQGTLVVNVDGFVLSSDKPPDMPFDACGYKAVISALSDIITKGATPAHILVSLSMPTDLLVKDALAIFEGIQQAKTDYRVTFSGGDLNTTSADVIIDVTAIGYCTNSVIKRHAALLPQDPIYWLGPPLGATKITLDYLLSGEFHSLSPQLQALVSQYMFYPKAQIAFLDIAAQHEVIAAIDSSDGISSALYQLIGETSYGITINPEILQAPSWHNCGSIDALISCIFHGGEEYGILFVARNFPIQDFPGLMRIGTVREKRGVVLPSGNIISNIGFEHFLHTSNWLK